MTPNWNRSIVTTRQRFVFHSSFPNSFAEGPPLDGPRCLSKALEASGLRAFWYLSAWKQPLRSEVWFVCCFVWFLYRSKILCCKDMNIEQCCVFIRRDWLRTQVIYFRISLCLSLGPPFTIKQIVKSHIENYLFHTLRWEPLTFFYETWFSIRNHSLFHSKSW